MVAEIKDHKSPFKLKLPEIPVLRNRRAELIATLGWVLMPIIFGPLSWLVLFILIKNTEVGKYLAILYLVWMYVDKESCERGGRRYYPFSQTISIIC